jgi:hypothetical protein
MTSTVCDHCVVFENRLRQLWETLFPGEPYQTAETTLDFLQIELEHLREQQKPQPAIARSPLEVQRAHDLLMTYVFHPVLQKAVPPSLYDQIVARLDILCWMLGHAHNASFDRTLRELESLLSHFGFCIIDSGRLNLPPDDTEEKQL